MADGAGQETIYLINQIQPGKIAIAALGLDYIRNIQKSIRFGKKGHSAIVDGQGNIMAHPNLEWQRQMKNIAKVKPVAKMMAGETGVTTFYSPAVKMDMISGFTTVPTTGWGIMVPQPLSELEENAGGVKRAALALVIFGLVVAGVISWLLSGLLVRPVEAVVQAAREIEDGFLEARVPRPSPHAPVEFQELGYAFNAMARDIGTVMLQHDRIQNELRQAHDELELRVQERTQELTDEIAERKKAEDSVRRSEERFRGAIESMQEGFALFDADDKLVALNDEYRRVSPVAQNILEKGGTFEDVFRANVARGVIEEAQGREEEFIRERMEQHNNPSGPIIRRFTDGTWYMIVESKTPEGGTAISFIDITELKLAEEALNASRMRFKDYAEVASDWFWEMDEELRFSYFSGRNFQLTGYNPEDLIGKTRAELANENLEDPRWREHFADLLAHRPFRDFSYQLTNPTGEVLHISISGTPVFDADGEFQGYRGTGTNVTSQVKSEEALREAMEEAKFANLAKTEFLANMSHELRTPLNSVIGFSDLLMDEKTSSLGPDKASEYVLDINNSGKHLLELINDILDIARIERGLLELNEKKLDVPLLMASCQRLVYDRAFDAGVELKTEVSKALPPLLADELRIKQILLNLLSNAIKFTPQGGSINFKADIDEEEHFQLSVADTGIGIAPEHIETALTDFGQVDGTLARKYDGAGLGLPLSKKLAELHGGELIIVSKPGSGTTVTVRFPSERTIGTVS
ncbi:MAG: PAS-domain containing protein [Rhodospirillales bacterium]|nr:PAS-domain containing protein [Rhodospirillales bacterium]